MPLQNALPTRPVQEIIGRKGRFSDTRDLSTLIHNGSQRVSHHLVRNRECISRDDNLRRKPGDDTRAFSPRRDAATITTPGCPAD